MRNLKKSLALVLALVMALSVAAFADFTDVKSDAANAEAINTLSDLGLLTGYTDGSYQPAGVITRAEASAVIYRMLTGKTTPVAIGATSFSDVPATHWASGYVNYCTEMGIVNGYPDGTFLPDQQVSYVEFAAMLLRALGYDTSSYSWPNGYVAMADALWINEDLAVTGINDLLARGQAAQMAYNTVFNANYIAKNTILDNFTTIAEKVFDIFETTALVTAVADGEITLDAAEDMVDGTYETNKDASYIGLNVKVLYKFVNGDIVVVAIVPVDNAQNEYKAAEFDKDDANYVAGDTWVIDANNKKVEVAGAAVHLNGSVSNLATLEGKLDANNLVTIRLVDNDDDAAIDYIFALEYSVEVVTLVTADKVYTDATTYNLKDADGKATNVVVPVGLKKDDVVLVYADGEDAANNAELTLLAKKTGKVTETDGSKVYIDGVGYAIEKTVEDAAVLTKLSVGSSYDYYVDGLFGYIVKADAVETEVTAVYVKAYGEKENAYGEIEYVLKVLKADGTEEELVINDSKWDDDTYGALNTVFNTPGGHAGIYELEMSGGKVVGADAKVLTAAAIDAATKEGNTIKLTGTGVINSVDAKSMIVLIDADGNVSVHVGTVPAFTIGAGGVKIATDAAYSFPVIDYAVVSVGAGGTTEASGKSNVPAYINSIVEKVSGSKYVAQINLVINGKLETVTSAEYDAQGGLGVDAGDYGYALVDLNDAGLIKAIKVDNFHRQYLVGKDAKVLDLRENYVDITPDYYTLTDDVVVYIVADDKATVGAAEALIPSIVNKDANGDIIRTIGYKVVYRVDADDATKIDVIFFEADGVEVTGGGF